jgi:four helix bundle protein
LNYQIDSEFTFEDLVIEENTKPFSIQERCLVFSKTVISFVRTSKYERVFISMFDQLVRSSTSIGANVVESKSGSSKKDWLKFMIIALKSSNETSYWLKLIADTLDVDKEESGNLLNEVNELSNIIAKIIINAQKSV